MKALVYSFEPFEFLKENPAQSIAQDVSASLREKHEAELLILPVDFEDSRTQLIEKLNEFKPDLVLGVGTSNRPVVSIERLAVNFIDYPKPAKNGKITRHEKIIKDGATALETKEDLQSLVNFLKEKNIPAHLSYDAGTNACNFAYYLSLKNCEKSYFVHVPVSPQEVNRLDATVIPSFPPHLISQALIEYFTEK